MKVLSRGRAVDETQVVPRSRLEKPFRAGARMLWTLAFVSVRQEKHERWCQPPLRAARGDELIEHDLCPVDEVAVLRLPDYQPTCLLDVVAKLETDGGGLAERAVVDLECRASLWK